MLNLLQLIYKLRPNSNYFNFGYRYTVSDCQTEARMNKWINKIRQDDILKIWYRYIENFDISAGDTIRYDISISIRYSDIVDISKQH